jgi:LacI family transcriptional regulator
MGKPTIHEVAAKADVSVKTVSRVMNNYPHVSKATRGRVERAIASLNYAPSEIARQMRLGDRKSIGMLYGDPSSEYQSQLNHSMLKACAHSRLYLSVELFNEKAARWVSQVESFLDRTRVTRMVLVPPMSDSDEIHEMLAQRDVRFVLISPSRPVKGAASVAMDDRLAAKQVTQHLISLGHRRIGHIAGHEDHVVTLLRRLGYEDALAMERSRTGGSDVFQIDVLSGRFRFKDALDKAEIMLSATPRPTAIFAANDQMALAVMMVAHRMGLSVPGDLSVAGFDDTPVSRSIWPSLTTVAQPFDAIARSAIRLLDEGQSDEAGSFIVLPHKLIVRGSTGPVPA